MQGIPILFRVHWAKAAHIMRGHACGFPEGDLGYLILGKKGYSCSSVMQSYVLSIGFDSCRAESNLDHDRGFNIAA